MPDINSHYEKTNSQPTLKIDDIIGDSPAWIVRSGIVLIFLIVAVLLGLSAIIRFPDKITASGYITSDFPSVQIIAEKSGVIDSLYALDRDTILIGEPLLMFENQVSLDDVNSIVSLIEEYKSITFLPDVLNLHFPEEMGLGELSNGYAEFRRALGDFQILLKSSGVFRQIHTLTSEIQKTQELKVVLESELELTKQEFLLVDRNYKRNSILHDDGIISDLDHERRQGEWLRFQRQLSNLDNGIIQNAIRCDQLQLNIETLKEERESSVQRLRLSIGQTILNLEAQLLNFNQKYFIHATQSGIISIPDMIKSRRYLLSGDVVGTVLPINKNKMQYAIAKISEDGKARISLGDKVILRFPAYPYKEFGVVLSEVQSIALQSTKGDLGSSLFDVKVLLSPSVISTYGFSFLLEPNQELAMEIITNDRSILSRVFDQFTNLFRNNQ